MLSPWHHRATLMPACPPHHCHYYYSPVTIGSLPSHYPQLMPLTTPTPLRVDAPIQLFPRPPSHTLGGARDVAERYEIHPALKWFNVQLVITKGRTNALVVWPRVSSVDQSSCLRQTGCNQACHIDHHQALLHHRRSIHHCIGGAGHSLVTDPPPLLILLQNSTNPRTLERRSKIGILRIFAMTRWRTSKGLAWSGSWWSDSPSE